MALNQDVEVCNFSSQFGDIYVENGKLIVEIDRDHFEDTSMLLPQWLRVLEELLKHGCFDDEDWEEIVVRPAK